MATSKDKSAKKDSKVPNLFFGSKIPKFYFGFGSSKHQKKEVQNREPSPKKGPDPPKLLTTKNEIGPELVTNNLKNFITGNTKGGSITVPLVSCLTGLD